MSLTREQREAMNAALAKLLEEKEPYPDGKAIEYLWEKAWTAALSQKPEQPAANARTDAERYRYGIESGRLICRDVPNHVLPRNVKPWIDQTLDAAMQSQI